MSSNLSGALERQLTPGLYWIVKYEIWNAQTKGSSPVVVSSVYKLAVKY